MKDTRKELIKLIKLVVHDGEKYRDWNKIYDKIIDCIHLEIESKVIQKLCGNKPVSCRVCIFKHKSMTKDIVLILHERCHLQPHELKNSIKYKSCPDAYKTCPLS